MRKRRFYFILTALTVLGYIWLAYHFVSHEPSNVTLCLFKRITSLPCPACGTSRSVLLIADGAFSQALVMNPLGYLLATGLLILPFWLSYDFIRGRQTLFRLSEHTNVLARKKWLVLLLASLVLLNWIWNIDKGL